RARRWSSGGRTAGRPASARSHRASARRSAPRFVRRTSRLSHDGEREPEHHEVSHRSREFDLGEHGEKLSFSCFVDGWGSRLFAARTNLTTQAWRGAKPFLCGVQTPSELDQKSTGPTSR